MDANSCEAVAMQTSVWTPSRNDKRNPAPVDMEEGKSSFCFLWCIQYRNWCKISDNNRMILKFSNWYMILATNRNLWHVRLLAHQMGFLRDRHWDRSSCIWLSGREIDMQYKYIYVSIDIYIYIYWYIYIYTWLGNHMLPPGYGAQMILIFHSLGPRHFLLCIYIYVVLMHFFWGESNLKSEYSHWYVESVGATPLDPGTGRMGQNGTAITICTDVERWMLGKSLCPIKSAIRF